MKHFRIAVLPLACLFAGCGSGDSLQPTPSEPSQKCLEVEDCRPPAPGSCLVARCHVQPGVVLGDCEYLPFTNGDDCK